jgi:hypothetical protein
MAIATDRQMVSIDPHIRGADWYGPSGGSLEWLKKNIKHYNLEDRTEIIVDCSENVKWDGRKIAFLHIDGAHDYEHVSYDFCHFQQYIPTGGYVAFHDNKLKYLLDVNRVVVDEVPLFGFKLVGRTDNNLSAEEEMKTLVIAGKGHGYMETPINLDRVDEIWGVNDYFMQRYCDLVFEMHDFSWSIFDCFHHVYTIIGDKAPAGMLWKRAVFKYHFKSMANK